MLKLTLKPGEFINIGENVKVIFSGGSANNIHLLIDAPREVSIERSNMNRGTRSSSVKKSSPYYKEQAISKEAQREIAQIIKREKSKM